MALFYVKLFVIYYAQVFDVRLFSEKILCWLVLSLIPRIRKACHRILTTSLVV